MPPVVCTYCKNTNCRGDPGHIFARAAGQYTIQTKKVCTYDPVLLCMYIRLKSQLYKLYKKIVQKVHAGRGIFIRLTMFSECYFNDRIIVILHKKERVGS